MSWGVDNRRAFPAMRLNEPIPPDRPLMFSSAHQAKTVRMIGCVKWGEIVDS